MKEHSLGLNYMNTNLAKYHALVNLYVAFTYVLHCRVKIGLMVPFMRYRNISRDVLLQM